jgi:hypothetical protein
MSMTEIAPAALSNAIMGKLYNVLTNGDDTVPKSGNNFFSWLTPGMPFREDDFDFLTQGLTGIVKRGIRTRASNLGCDITAIVQKGRGA